MARDIWWRTARGALVAVVAAMMAVTVAAPVGAETTAPPSSSTPTTPPPLPGTNTPPAVIPPPSAKEAFPAAKDAAPAARESPPAAKEAPAADDGKPSSRDSAKDAPPEEPKASGDASTAKTLSLEARPVLMLKGQSDWDDGFKTVMASLQTIRDARAKANIKGVGHPLTVFRETDDNGFKFEAMIPIDPATDTKTKLDSNVSFGQSPAGKALKFQHRGAYEEIDSTYEAITAYLDEKGYDTKNLFIEEYLNSAKSADDTDFQVDIYVLVK